MSKSLDPNGHDHGHEHEHEHENYNEHEHEHEHEHGHENEHEREHANMGISSNTAHVLLDIKIITDTYVHTVKMKVKKYFREKIEKTIVPKGLLALLLNLLTPKQIRLRKYASTPCPD